MQRIGLAIENRSPAVPCNGDGASAENNASFIQLCDRNTGVTWAGVFESQGQELSFWGILLLY